MTHLLDTALITIGLVVCAVFWTVAAVALLVPLALAVVGYLGYELADYIDVRRSIRALERRGK